MKEQLIITFLQVQTQFRILHWQTTSFARHKAYDEIYGSLDENIDKFVEAYQGKYGRFQFAGESATITLFNLKTLKINPFLKTFIGFLNSLSQQFPNDTDLLNIRDEMLGDINKLKYLLTLK